MQVGSNFIQTKNIITAVWSEQIDLTPTPVLHSWAKTKICITTIELVASRIPRTLLSRCECLSFDELPAHSRSLLQSVSLELHSKMPLIAGSFANNFENYVCAGGCVHARGCQFRWERHKFHIKSPHSCCHKVKRDSFQAIRFNRERKFFVWINTKNVCIESTTAFMPFRPLIANKLHSCGGGNAQTKLT